jgi:cytochrome c-type biogenesis protein CcmH
MGIRFAVLVIAVMLLGATSSFAVEPDEILADPKLEKRAREISAELRCLVCQNQSIDDSNAPLARDLRLLVRERIRAGDSDRQVMQYVVDRYGKFVLLKPPFDAQTLLLWLAPLLVLVGAGLVISRGVRRAAPTAPAAGGPLTPAEEGRLRALLSSDERKAAETAKK